MRSRLRLEGISVPRLSTQSCVDSHEAAQTNDITTRARRIALVGLTSLTFVFASSVPCHGHELDPRLGFILLQCMDQISLVRSIEFAAEVEDLEEEPMGVPGIELEAIHQKTYQRIRYWGVREKFRHEVSFQVGEEEGSSGTQIILFDGRTHQQLLPDSGRFSVSEWPLFPWGGMSPTPLVLPFAFLRQPGKSLDWSNLVERLGDLQLWMTARWLGWHGQGDERCVVFELPHPRGEGRLKWRIYFSPKYSYYPVRTEFLNNTNNECLAHIVVEKFQSVEVGQSKTWLPLAVTFEGVEPEARTVFKSRHRINAQTLKVNHPISDSLFVIPATQVKRVYEVPGNPLASELGLEIPNSRDAGSAMPIPALRVILFLIISAVAIALLVGKLRGFVLRFLLRSMS